MGRWQQVQQRCGNASFLEKAQRKMNPNSSTRDQRGGVVLCLSASGVGAGCSGLVSWWKEESGTGAQPWTLNSLL